MLELGSAGCADRRGGIGGGTRLKGAFGEGGGGTGRFISDS